MSLLIVKAGASAEGFVENCFYDRFYSPYGGCGEKFLEECYEWSAGSDILLKKVSKNAAIQTCFQLTLSRKRRC